MEIVEALFGGRTLVFYFCGSLVQVGLSFKSARNMTMKIASGEIVA